jgi:hypothetical protein
MVKGMKYFRLRLFGPFSDGRFTGQGTVGRPGEWNGMDL